MATDNFRKHSSKNPLQQFFISRFFVALIAEVRALHPTSILDAGCGEGFTLERFRLAGVGAHLEGIDLNPGAIDLGRTPHPHLALTQGSVYQLPYADNTFDLVVCTEVLEHLERPADALTELSRVAKRYVIITVPHEPFFQMANLLRGKNISRWGNDSEHIQHWSSPGIAEMIGGACRIKTVRTPFPWTLVVGEKRA